MTSDHVKPEAGTAGSPFLILEIAGQQKPTPRLIPVLIQNLSMGGVTLATPAPWDIADWDHYRGKIAYCGWKILGDRKLSRPRPRYPGPRSATLVNNPYLWDCNWFTPPRRCSDG